MNYIFKFPDIGEGLDEGTILEWLVSIGQKVELGESLLSMETDKIVTDIPSPRTGIIKTLHGKKGDVIHVGEVLVEIEIEDESENKSESENQGVVGTLKTASEKDILSSSTEGLSNIDKKEIENHKTLATPVIRALAKEKGIDINKVQGSGTNNRVMREDLLSYNESTVNDIKIEHLKGEERTRIEPLNQIRKTIAKNMLASKQKTARISVFEEVEISEIEKIRLKYKEIYSEENIKITYLPFIIKATCLALKEVEIMNAEMNDEKEIIIYKNYINIGIAVDTEKGLMVPVIKDADKKSIKELSIEINSLAKNAREGKLKLEDFKDGTFTITSFGSMGGLFGSPIINYPEVGILGIGRISKKPIVKFDKLDIGLVLPLSLSADHRVLDGAEMSTFINLIMRYLSDPILLMMH